MPFELEVSINQNNSLFCLIIIDDYYLVKLHYMYMYTYHFQVVEAALTSRIQRYEKRLMELEPHVSMAP